MQIIEDPHDIPTSAAPMIVFSDHTSGLIEWLIKMRTGGVYNHVMFFLEQGRFVSQGNTYSRVGMKRYMRRGNRLLFVKINGLNDEQKHILRVSIEKKLARKWWKKLYDWPGILGQAIGIKKININGLNYCSEDVYYHLTRLLPVLTEENSLLVQVIQKMDPHGSPQDHRDLFKTHKEVFEPVFLWQSDLGA